MSILAEKSTKMVADATDDILPTGKEKEIIEQETVDIKVPGKIGRVRLECK